MDRTATWRAAVAVVALLLLWQVLAVNGVVYDAGGHPRLPGSTDRASIAAALRDNPAEIALLLTLAQADANAGREADVRAELHAAREIAPIDRDALGISAALLLRQGRAAEAVERLSVLASTFGERDKVFPVLARLLASGDPSWSAIAAAKPRWMRAFVLDQCRRGTDALLLAPLLSPPGPGDDGTGAEVECVTERLRSKGRWGQAYQAWLNTLPRARLADVGFVFNGGFEFPATGVGFDWKPSAGAERDTGHLVEFAPVRGGGSGQRALRVSYNGKRQSAAAISQFLALPTGRYELAGMARVDRLNTVRGVRWVVQCASEERIDVLGESERFLGSSEWRRFAFEVDVPPGCLGERLLLEPVGLGEGTTFLSGSVWFDDLALRVRR